MMSDLHTRCGSAKKQLLRLHTGTHNETWTVKGYYHALAIFLQNNRIHNVESKSQSIEVVQCQQLAKSTDWSNVHII